MDLQGLLGEVSKIEQGVWPLLCWLNHWHIYCYDNDKKFWSNFFTIGIFWCSHRDSFATSNAFEKSEYDSVILTVLVIEISSEEWKLHDSGTDAFLLPVANMGHDLDEDVWKNSPQIWLIMNETRISTVENTKFMAAYQCLPTHWTI